MWLLRTRGNANPVLPLPRHPLASAYAPHGETERAAVAPAEARRLGGDNRLSSLARLMAAVPKVRALFETTYLAGLRKVGMPEK